MSRGHGRVQSYLADLILSSPEPMTFAEIMAIAYPEGSFEFDMAKAIGGSKVGRVRSLRRALRRLCNDDTIMVIGKGGRGDPHRYWRHPIMMMDGPHAISIGQCLLEGRCQMSHRAFGVWVEQNFNMSLEQAEAFMDAAHQARLSDKA